MELVLCIVYVRVFCMLRVVIRVYFELCVARCLCCVRCALSAYVCVVVCICCVTLGCCGLHHFCESVDIKSVSCNQHGANYAIKKNTKSPVNQ